ncbi:crosslink repair DNA glycosylase YcaQ family protein [Microbacterium sp. CCNWLW134]|uniref:DNA glycosylase AlkZ-like family protein n=1 Tax=Microbacterium sp. CCNWLW134 TaxID=3122064 RepID=UPI00300FD3F9
MKPVPALSRAEAARIAVRAQLLTAPRPGDIVESLQSLTVLPIDPTAAIAPSADLILWSRIGWPYEPADFRRLFHHDRVVFEWRGFFRPMSDLPLFLPQMRRGPRSAAARDWLAANDRFRRDILGRLRDDGPLRPVDIDDTAAVPWRSTGWTNDRNVLQMLEMLTECAEVAVDHRDAKGRWFDLAERVYPAVAPVTDDEAARGRAERRLSALGIARRKGVAQPGEPVDVGDVGVEVVVDGVDGRWRVDPVLLDTDGEPSRTALLSPHDRLVFDRVRLRELFGFDYVLEMYKPAASRRWGYFALPILHGDRLVGKLDAALDRRAGTLRINAVHEDETFTSSVSEAVDAEIDDLARWLGVEVSRL